ncbi:hypothetical protein ABGB07_18610 [Micromonosporaceae bacterium B7E4]
MLQRRSGYDGFGDANAPVRMAAHRHQRLAEVAAPVGDVPAPVAGAD